MKTTADKFSEAKTLMAELFNELRQLNPIVTEHGKYLQLTMGAHGYGGDEVECNVYFGIGLQVSPASYDDILKAIAEFDPVAVKAKRIAELRAELAELEAVESPAENVPA